MPSMVTVTIRGKPVKVLAGSKSAIARALLGAGYTVSEIAKAVPMAYSQVHSIWKKHDFLDEQIGVVSYGDPKRGKTTLTVGSEPVETRLAREALKTSRSSRPAETPARSTRYERAVKRAETRTAHRALDRERKSDIDGLPAGSKLKINPRVGKLRIGNLPKDIPVGTCANCGYDLVVRPGPTGYLFVHVNVTAEEYMATVQFCQAVPERLVK